MWGVVVVLFFVQHTERERDEMKLPSCIICFFYYFIYLSSYHFMIGKTFTLSKSSSLLRKTRTFFHPGRRSQLLFQSSSSSNAAFSTTARRHHSSDEGVEIDSIGSQIPSSFQSKFLEVMLERGFIHQCTDFKTLDEKLASGVVAAYLGFDATAKSLHVGSLLQIMILRKLQQCGHKPIVLIGGGTTKVGDPTGKDESRKLLSGR